MWAAYHSNVNALSQIWYNLFPAYVNCVPLNKERGGQITIIDCFTTQTTACLKFDFRLDRIRQQRNFLLSLIFIWRTTQHPPLLDYNESSFWNSILCAYNWFAIVCYRIKGTIIYTLKSIIKTSTIHKNLQETTCSILFYDDSSHSLEKWWNYRM